MQLVNHAEEVIEEMKEIGAEDDIPEDETGWSPLRLHVAHTIKTSRFEMAVGSLVLFNIYLVIIETDAVAQEVPAPLWARVVGIVLLASYIAEIACRVYVHRGRFIYDPWNIMDCSVVGIDVAGLVIGMVSGDLPSVAILRIFRLVKIAKAYRVIRAFPELHLIVKGLAGAANSIFWGMLLTVIVLIIYAILAVQFIHPLNVKVSESGAYEGCDRCPRAFESVANAFLTFLQQIVAGDAWGELSVPIIEQYPLAGFFLMMVFVSVQIAVLNLILAATVDSAMEARKGSEHEIAKAKDLEYKKSQDTPYQTLHRNRCGS
eukprot:gnl/TRDRNA2_/TRDRNA2_151381_c1_seq1.p1 gnl/TRDRNA2_/TRDRNA2_151381_c1~~gnl/TRDRNA2_/TRDRNA2_151381_c1_seq1.p1  ORF type:complete len:318 (+),score=43.85 gnl/TRDRNA2_/TRDRNA2_151381_c1_seq1:103-1056(+)